MIISLVTRPFTLSKQTFPSHVSEAAYYLRFYQRKYRRLYPRKYRKSNKIFFTGCLNANWREFWALLPIIQYNYFLLHKLSFKLKEKAALKNLAIFTGKHLCLLKRDSFLKNRLQHRSGVFLWILQNVLNTYFEESCERLLLRLNLGSHLRVSA